MHQLFVTQIYQSKIKELNKSDLKDLKSEIFKILKADILGQKWSEKNYVNGYSSYGSWDQLNKLSSSFADLEKYIKPHVNKFAKTLDFNIKKSDLKMNSIWVNIMPEGALHASHIHPLSVISGTFYVEVPPKASSIKFEDPRLGLFMNTPATKEHAKKVNLRFYSLEPKAGELVLFESWLKHEVPMNKSKSPRISISFNYGWS